MHILYTRWKLFLSQYQDLYPQQQEGGFLSYDTEGKLEAG